MSEHPLRKLRNRNKLSLDDLASKCNASKASLSRIETGQQQPDFEIVRELVALSKTIDPDEPLTEADFVNFVPSGEGQRSAA